MGRSKTQKFRCGPDSLGAQQAAHSDSDSGLSETIRRVGVCYKTYISSLSTKASPDKETGLSSESASESRCDEEDSEDSTSSEFQTDSDFQ